MMQVLERASKPIIDSRVTGFTNVTNTLLINFGSFLWFLLLVAFDVAMIGMSEWNVYGKTMFAVLLASNVLMFLFQTFNLLVFMFKMWPVVSLYYTMQFFAIGVCAGLVGQGLSEESTTKLAVSLVRLFAQSLFTSSQLSVTLEYLYRVSYMKDCRPSRATLVGRA